MTAAGTKLVAGKAGIYTIGNRDEATGMRRIPIKNAAETEISGWFLMALLIASKVFFNISSVPG